MPFQYSLQSILRLRVNLEKQAEQRLLAASALVSKLRNELREIANTHSLEEKKRQETLLRGAVASELHFALLAEAALDRRRARLQSKLWEAERQRTQQVALYQAARQRREILEALRDREEAAYELKAVRREQQQIDELFLLRAFLENRE